MSPRHAGTRHAGPPPAQKRQHSSGPLAGHPHEQPSGPFSRIVVVDRLPADTPTEITITAEPHERAALAEIDALEKVDRLEARLSLMRHGAGVYVTGEIEADVEQTCVVTLEPFPTTVREPVDVRFAPPAEVEALEAALARHGGESAENTLDTPDAPDPIIDGRIDLGALAAEFLTLGLDPHPRKPGVEFAADAGAIQGEGASEETSNVSPFAVLRGRVGKS